MIIQVICTNTLEDLEREVAVLKAMDWKPTGEGVPLWEDGQHRLEMERLEEMEETPETHWIAGFMGEESLSLNELSICWARIPIPDTSHSSPYHDWLRRWSGGGLFSRSG